MKYKVIPFKADIVAGEGQSKAAAQLEQLVNKQSDEGWSFMRLENMQTVQTTPGRPPVPGNNGCMGLGATPDTPAVPDRRETFIIYVAVFERAA